MRNSKNTESGININITHFINPHKFYFKFEHGQSRIETCFETSLNNYCIEHAEYRNPNYQPKINEIVAIFVPSLNKYIRANVDEILHFCNSESNYVLWALDEG